MLTVYVHIGGPVAALVGKRSDATAVLLFARHAGVCILFSRLAAAKVQVLDCVGQN